MNEPTELELEQHRGLVSLLDEYEGAAPERQAQIYEELRSQRDAENSQAQQQRLRAAEKLFGDVDTLGGTWTEEQQQFFAGVSPGPGMRADKASLANIQYIAAASDADEEEVAKAYPLLRDQFADREFGLRQVTDEGLYSLIQGRVAHGQQRLRESAKIAGLAWQAGVADAERGRTEGWARVFGQFDARQLEQLDPESAFFVGSAVYQKAKQIGDSHRELMLIAKDVLARETGREGEDHGRLRGSADPMGEAAKRLADITPEERRVVYAMLAVWGEQHGEAKKFLGQLAESFGRSPAAMGRGVISLVNEGALARYRKELLGDHAKVIAGQPASLRTLSSRAAENVSEFAEVDPMAMGTGVPSYGPLPAMRAVTPEERLKLLAEVDRELRLSQIHRELRHYAETVVDPIRDVLPADAPWLMHRLERGAYGVASTLPYLGIASIPYAGPVLVGAGMAGQEYDRLRVEFPDVPIEEARLIATVSGTIMGAIERAQAGQVLKGLPMLGQALRQFRTPTSSFWRGVLPHAARGVAVQNAQEFGQDITTPVVQNIVAALKQDVPHVDWDSQLGGWNGRVETFIALLPFALFGAGVQTRRENAMVQRALHEPELLAYAGFDAETAARIVETARTDEDAAEALFRAGWQVRSPEDIARGVALYEERAARAQALQESPETPTVRRTADDRFELREPDGALVATFDSEAAAMMGLSMSLGEDAPGGDNKSGESESWDTLGEHMRDFTLDAVSTVVKAFEHLGFRVDRDTDIGPKVGALENDELVVYLSPHFLHELVMEKGIDHRGAAETFVRRAIQEELIHAAAAAQMRERWLAAGGKGTLKDYLRTEYAAMAAEIVALREQLRAEGKLKELEGLERAVVATWETYGTFPKLNASGTDATDAIFERLAQEGEGDVRALFSGEFVRQLIQIRRSRGFTTETHYRKLLNTLTDYLKKALAALRRFSVRLRRGDPSLPLVRRTMDDITDRLAELEGLELIPPEGK